MGDLGFFCVNIISLYLYVFVREKAIVRMNLYKAPWNGYKPWIDPRKICSFWPRHYLTNISDIHSQLVE